MPKFAEMTETRSRSERGWLQPQLTATLLWAGFFFVIGCMVQDTLCLTQWQGN